MSGFSQRIQESLPGVPLQTYFLLAETSLAIHVVMGQMSQPILFIMRHFPFFIVCFKHMG